MRREKKIKIDDLEIRVFELTVEDLIGLMDSGEGASLAGSGGLPDFDKVKDNLPKCTDLDFEKLKKMAPSELEKIWEAFSEVNAVFFKMLARAGIWEMIRKHLPAIFSKAFADSLKPATPGPGNTA